MPDSNSFDVKCSLCVCVPNFHPCRLRAQFTPYSHLKSRSGSLTSERDINCILALWICTITMFLLPFFFKNYFASQLSPHDCAESLSDCMTGAQRCSAFKAAIIRHPWWLSLGAQLKPISPPPPSVWQEFLWHFAFEFVRSLCLQSCPTFLPFKTFKHL